MQYFALLSVAIVICVDATAISNTGSSVVQRSDDGHGNYAFAYKEQGASGGTTRSEKGGPGGVVGSYSLNDHDGRQRVVNYVADGHGFRAVVKTNEPGVDGKQDPADVSINGGSSGLGYAQPLAYAVPEVRIASPVALSYAEPELRGYGSSLGGYGGSLGGYGGSLGGYGGSLGGLGGPLGSYSVAVNHVSHPSLGGKLIGAPLLYGYGKGY